MSSSSPGRYTVQRRHLRYRLDVPVTLRHIQTSGGERHGRARSIGTGGMSALMAADVAAGELVELEFTLPGAESPLRVRAISRYHSHLYYGFEFVRLSDEQIVAIEAATAALELLP